MAKGGGGGALVSDVQGAGAGAGAGAVAGLDAAEVVFAELAMIPALIALNVWGAVSIHQYDIFPCFLGGEYPQVGWGFNGWIERNGLVGRFVFVRSICIFVLPSSLSASELPLSLAQGVAMNP